MAAPTGRCSKSEMMAMVESLRPSPPAPAREPGGESTDSSARSKPRSLLNVAVRIRPLLPKELKTGLTALPGLVTSSAIEPPAIAIHNQNGSSIGGFTAVHGPEAVNADVFSNSVSTHVETVLRGGSINLLCYGATGSGKTHTVLGYGSELGMYSLTATALLNVLATQEVNTPLFLSLSACELYGELCYDLLGSKKVTCELKTDRNGQLQIVGPSTTVDLAVLRPDLKLPMSEGGNQAHGTYVTRSTSLRTCAVHSVEGLDEAIKKIAALRTVGTSSEHSASSRSHAVLRLEIVTQPVLDARSVRDEARAALPALYNAADNLKTAYFDELLDIDSFDAQDDTVAWRTYANPDAWAEHKAVLDERMYILMSAIETAEADVVDAMEVVANLEQVHEAIGGSAFIVDLAGADKDTRAVGTGKGATTRAELKESANINKSLLALKECLRSIAGVPGASRTPQFRQSKITRLLEDALAPRPASTRRNRDTATVMLVNVSPVSHLERITINTLRYGQIFAAKGDRKAATKAAGAPRTSTNVGKPWQKKAAAPTRTGSGRMMREEKER